MKPRCYKDKHYEITNTASFAWHYDSDGQRRCQTFVTTRYSIVVGLQFSISLTGLMNYITYIMLFFLRLALTGIISAIRVKVTLATCGSLASTVSDSENDYDAFFYPSPVGSS